MNSIQKVLNATTQDFRALNKEISSSISVNSRFSIRNIK